jgi:PAS domain S-box-containing protein
MADSSLTVPAAALARILDLMPCGLMAKDPRRDLRYVIWNDYLARMTGLAAEDVVGRTDHEIFPADVADRYVASDREAIQGGAILRREGDVSQSAAPGHIINVSKMALRDEAGDPLLVFTVVEDLTEQHRLEHQMIQAHKMEAVGRLAGGIAHDFNNLLQVIMGYGELLRADLGAGAHREDLDRMLGAGRQAGGLVSQLLRFSHRDKPRLAAVDLDATIGGLHEVLQRVMGEEVDLSWRPGGDLSPVLADPESIEQMLLDLCVNARDAMPGGGTITLSTFAADLDEAWCLRHPGTQPGRYGCFSVSDTGLGIPADLLDTIFEPFFTTKETGTGSGLGLASVYATAQAQGGLVEVDSGPGRGATFTVRLPMAAAHQVVAATVAQPAAAASRPPAAPGAGRVVLVAEDQDEVRRLGASILERAGYRVLQARDGMEAVEVFRAHQGSVDLLLLDVVMPRLNGRAAYETIVAEGGRVPVIFCSGYNDDVLARDYLAGTPGELLPKPYRPADLLGRVDRACARRAQDPVVDHG